MSNVKVIKVNNIKVNKKTKKNSYKPNIEYLQNIVRKTKSKPNIDLSNSNLISNLLNKKKVEEPKKKVEEEPKKKVEEEPKKKVEETKKKVEETKKKVDKEPKKKVDKEPKKKVDKEPKKKVDKEPNKKKQKKIGKKVTTKSIISFFSKKDQNIIKNKTKRAKKLISSNLIAPKIDRKTKKKFYKQGVKNILLKDKKNRKEISKMTRQQLLDELTKNGIITKDSNAPDKVLKDLYHLFILVEATVSK